MKLFDKNNWYILITFASVICSFKPIFRFYNWKFTEKKKLHPTRCVHVLYLSELTTISFIGMILTIVITVTQERYIDTSARIARYLIGFAIYKTKYEQWTVENKEYITVTFCAHDCYKLHLFRCSSMLRKFKRLTFSHPNFSKCFSIFLQLIFFINLLCLIDELKVW